MQRPPVKSSWPTLIEVSLYLIIVMWLSLQNLFLSLVDRIDGGMSGSIPDLPSFLPGVNRSAYLASQEQLDNLVGVA